MEAAFIIWVSIVVAIGLIVWLLAESFIAENRESVAINEKKDALKAYRWKMIMQTTDLRAGTSAGEAKIDVKTQM